MVRQTIHTPGSALHRTVGGGWGWHEENTARLYEALSYWLDLAWIDRTTDPDDPKVKRERALAKRQGIQPPPHPLIPPMALRPPEIADERLRHYLDEVEKYQPPERSGKQLVSSAEFDRVLGL